MTQKQKEHKRHLRRMADPVLRARFLKGIRRWKKKNRAKVQASYHRNKHKHKARIKKICAKYYRRNRKRILKRCVAYNARRIKIDPAFKLINRCRIRLYHAVKGYRDEQSLTELLGCSAERFRLYIESLWGPGMTWKNYGLKGWHLDHKIPCCKFDFSDPEQVKKCFHFTNLQPLWAKDNLAKSRKEAVA